MSQTFFGPTQLPLDVLQVKTTNILEFDPLEQVPGTFLRIELRSIGSQTFEISSVMTPSVREEHENRVE